jgi:hypothetical protein
MKGPVMAQAKFIATISPAIIGKDETAEFKLLVENAQQGATINAPVLKGFTVISGPYQESGMEEINGNIKRYVGYTYILKPTGKGIFTIASTTAKVDGKLLKSNPVSIKVTNATNGNSSANSSPFSSRSLSPFDEPAPSTNYSDFILKKGEDIQDKISRNIFIRATANKTTCFVGEPVVANYKLYTRLKSESNIIKSPSFSGFSVIDLVQPASGNYNIETVNGRQYNVYTLRKAQLYPLQNGVDTMESMAIENNINFIKEAYVKTHNRPDDFFADALSDPLSADAMQVEKATLQTKPISILVKPLPATNQPASFTGAVGNFNLQARVEKSNFTTDESGKLQLTIGGEGNLTLVNAPEIKWPAGIEVFESSLMDSLNRLTVPVSGSKTFSFPFTISKPGSYMLPSIELSFFDVVTATYKIIQTQPIPLTVTNCTGKKLITSANIDNPNTKEQFFETLFTNRWMIIVPVALLIITGLLVWLWLDRKKQSPKTKIIVDNDIISATEVTNIVVADPLAVSTKLIQNQSIPAKEFYAVLHKELSIFLSNELQLQPETFSKKSIEEKINKAGKPVSLGFEINQLLGEIELHLYTPFDTEINRLSIYEQAYKIVNYFKKSS